MYAYVIKQELTNVFLEMLPRECTNTHYWTDSKVRYTQHTQLSLLTMLSTKGPLGTNFPSDDQLAGAFETPS